MGMSLVNVQDSQCFKLKKYRKEKPAEKKKRLREVRREYLKLYNKWFVPVVLRVILFVDKIKKLYGIVKKDCLIKDFLKQTAELQSLYAYKDDNCFLNRDLLDYIGIKDILVFKDEYKNDYEKGGELYYKRKIPLYCFKPITYADAADAKSSAYNTVSDTVSAASSDALVRSLFCDNDDPTVLLDLAEKLRFAKYEKVQKHLLVYDYTIEEYKNLTENDIKKLRDWMKNHNFHKNYILFNYEKFAKFLDPIEHTDFRRLDCNDIFVSMASDIAEESYTLQKEEITSTLYHMVEAVNKQVDNISYFMNCNTDATYLKGFHIFYKVVGNVLTVENTYSEIR